MRWRVAAWPTALMLAVVLCACGESYRGEPLRGPFPASSAAGSSGATSHAVLAEGQRVYDRYCHQCHPGGAGGLAPALNNKPAPGWLIRFQVRQGMGAMPAFGADRISADELDVLVTYAVELRRHGE